MVEISTNLISIIMWQQWVNGILGLWVIIIPFVGLGSNSKIVLIVTGVVIAILGFWGALQKSA